MSFSILLYPVYKKLDCKYAKMSGGSLEAMGFTQTGLPLRRASGREFCTV